MTLVTPPTRLLAAAQGAFTSRSGRQGKAYFDEGRVTIEGADEDTVVAFVRGSRPRPYGVAVRFAEVATRGRLQVSCTCSYFLEGYPCKHIYATLLAIDVAGIQMVNPELIEARLDVVPFKPDLPLDQDWFFEGEHTLRRLTGGEEGRARTPEWQDKVRALRRALGNWQDKLPEEVLLERGAPRSLRFLLDGPRSEELQVFVVAVEERRPGDPHPRPLGLRTKDLHLVPVQAEREALALLLDTPLEGPAASSTERLFVVPQAAWPRVAAALVASGVFLLRGAEGEAEGALTLDDGAPYDLSLAWRPEAESEDELVLRGELLRGEEAHDHEDLVAVLPGGYVALTERIIQARPAEGLSWLRYLRKAGTLRSPQDALPKVLAELVSIPGLPPLALPEPWQELTASPEPEVVFAEPKPRSRYVVGQVFFHYHGGRFAVGSRESGLVDEVGHRVVRRAQDAEREHVLRLAALGARRAEEVDDLRVQVLQEHLPGLVRQLVSEGWRVEASGRRMRGLSGQSLQLTSGVDWFELSGELDFEGVQAGLPELLEAIKAGSRFVRLGDGSEGLLPEAWLERYGALANLGSKKAGKLRFASSQAILLDLLLEGQDEVALDEGFMRARAAVDRNARVEPMAEPEGFVGTLRDYQRLGLGWMVFLRKIGLGGCLADDMGLGKTVQVLAMLAHRKREGLGRPSLVVAPRSLIHNWMDEARRFVPGMKVLAFVGPERHLELPGLASYDLIITTYGTLRRDVEVLAGVALDYVILDEAQAIKNAGAQASKAARLLQGEHRLALSGTPIENHLAELWSIFEFLNPRMLGARRDFASLARADQRGALTRVARGLAPLILRRTKGQVLSELPAKTELTVFCEMDEDEGRRYRELRDHLRRSLTERVQTEGMGRAKIHVLEALLRLRQAACHPGLLDDKRRGLGSAKVDTLLAHLGEVLAEGHKALVFSQFVQLLSIVRERLDAEGIPYAYLDGSTKDRESVVRSFQEGDERPVFLISLRAGGLGLNLTEADYVYILDPWWNPAVEAQAIDRAHRIGQTRPVFAYRLIAQGTVEEKIQALQAEKVELAEAIVASNEGLIERLTLDDLRGLLS
jgi:hypothetical protein